MKGHVVVFVVIVLVLVIHSAQILQGPLLDAILNSGGIRQGASRAKLGVAVTDERAAEERATEEQGPLVPPYNSKTIAKTVLTNVYQPTRLLIYANSTFQLFSLGDKTDRKIPGNLEFCKRCESILPILVPALLELDLPPFFQLLFSDVDFTYSSCTTSQQCNDTRTFAPVLHFGSVLKNYAEFLPTMIAYPTPNYLNCIREWRLFSNSRCTAWKLTPSKPVSLQDLQPQLIWRGSNFKFLHTLSREHFTNETSVPQFPFFPRAGLSNISKYTPWVDAETIGGIPTYMSLEDTAAFRYQVDLGGAGGTTWTGTVEKLNMPGVLFHHETPAMDWFYPMLVPWKHHIPIRTDLGDLQAKYEWAEAHLDQAQNISIAASAFVRDFFSRAELERQYQRYFRDYLGRVVSAYRHEGDFASILKWYGDQGLHVTPWGNCSHESCIFCNQTRKGEHLYKFQTFDSMK